METSDVKLKCLVQLVKQAVQSCLPQKKVRDLFRSEESRLSNDVRRTSLGDCAEKSFPSRTPVAVERDGGDRPELEKFESVEAEDDDGDGNEEMMMMTFQKLPFDCKLKIFSFLDPNDRGVAERVCSEWKEVVRSPTLWTTIDLSGFCLPPSSRCKPAVCDEDAAAPQVSSHSNVPCVAPDVKSSPVAKAEKRKQEAEAGYERYKSRVFKFIEYAKEIKPCVVDFRFSFDIGDSQDGWTQAVKSFLDSARTKNMKRAAFNWRETPAKHAALLDSSNTWSTGNYSDLMYKQRRRQRLFVSFFDSFTALAPNLRCLALPFDWSASSVAHLSRLGSTLVQLALEEYFVPQPLEQLLLDKLLSSLPNLEKLSVGLVLGSGLGMLGYEFNSSSLRSLDLSKCQGFALTKVDLPNLKELRTNNASFPSQLNSGEVEVLRTAAAAASSNAGGGTASLLPLTSSKSLPLLSRATVGTAKLPVPSGIPCLFNVLKKGAPSLEKLNDYKLKADWTTGFDAKLEQILHEACPCLYHHHQYIS